MAEPSIYDLIQNVLPTVPAPIQDLLSSDRPQEVIRGIVKRYALHVDEGALVERELILLLLGVEDPGQVAQTLYDSLSASDGIVDDIMSDFNKEIFMPLQAQMRAEPQSAAPAQTPTRPQPISPAPVPQAKPAPVAPPVPPAQPAPQVAAPVQPTPRPIPPAPRPGTVPSAPLPPKTILPQTPAARPTPDFQKIVPLPANLPGAMPLKPVMPPPQTPPAAEPKPPARPYSVDPYREPLDGN